ncbi:MAG: permease [Spirochaetota bacterium]|nr:permease [Spirochaetota bacterium]
MNTVQIFQKFMTIVVEISVLFLIINFLVSLIQQYLPEEKIQKILGTRQGKGYFFAALLGSITPFCTCSTIPMLKGLLKAKAGFGATMVFLFVSPLLNPIIITLFVTILGLNITIFYICIALFFGIGSGILLEQLGFNRYIISQNTPKPCCCSSTKESKLTSTRLSSAWQSSLNDFKNIIPHLLISAGAGAIIYGYVPDNILAEYIGDKNPFAIPVATVIGIPLYVRASVLLPLVPILTSKGVSMGAMLALIIGGSGASLPEVILLKSLFKTPLIIAFLFVILSMALAAGYLIPIIL